MIAAAALLSGFTLIAAHVAAPTAVQEDALVAALLRRDADAALAVMEGVSSPAARAVRAAVWELRGDPRAVSERAGLPPPDAAPPIAPLRASLGTARELLFISASVARLRDSPTQTGEVISELPIGTPVEVRERKKGFARVRVGRRTVRVDRPGQVATLVPPARFPALHAPDAIAANPSGWVALSLLDGAVPVKDTHVALGNAAAARAEHALAAAHASRASALDPHDVSVRTLLVRSALRAGDAALAVQAGLLTPETPLQLSDGPDDQIWPDGTIALAAGCRGDVTRAGAVLEPDAKRAPADACVVDVDMRDPCPPRDARQDPGSSSPEENAAFLAQLATDIDAHDDVIARRRAARAALLAKFTGGPVIVIDLKRAASAPLPTLSLVRVPLVAGQSGCGADIASVGPLVRTPLLLPRSPDSEVELRIVIAVDSLEGALWALEPSTPGAPPVPSMFAGVSGAQFDEGQAFAGWDEQQGAHASEAAVIDALGTVRVPFIRLAAPSFCRVTDCVP